MSTNKRLFLFAGFDKDNIIDDALVYYISKLSKFGDVIVCIDSDCDDTQTDKLKPFTIHTIAKRHGEYDFGSYKRAFEYARNSDILKNYDYLYLVNDSVFGPLFDMGQIIKKIENSDSDSCCLVVSKHKTHKFMESWFIRLNKKIFMSVWFDEFISSVQHEEYKYLVTVKYEHGLTNVIKNNGCSWDGIYKFHGRFTYNNPKRLFKIGCPFVKKASFTRHNGGVGNQIKYVLKHANTNARDAIMNTAGRVYGKKYMNWLLTSNPLKIFYRNITYLFKKVENGEI
jgi:lipopolysaccharide biosynthesis protein